MFQPETEDMLPRMAPKPSPDVPSGATDGIMRPQVPEVSILFGQQDANMQQQALSTASQQQNKNAPQQTYAAWKKQMLPKVTYPAKGGMQFQNNNMVHDYNSSRTNLYPIRKIPPEPVNLPTNTNLNGFGSSNDGEGVAKQLVYRRSLESCDMGYQQIQHLPTLPLQRPLATVSQLPNTNSGDVLTICASTQTDAILESTKNYLQNLQPDHWSNLASKKDVENVRQLLNELKVEQQSMLNMLEKILFGFHSQMPVKTQCRDIGIQVDSIVSDVVPYVNGDVKLIPDQQQNNCLETLKLRTNILQTPKAKPIAESTMYRANAPQYQLLQRNLKDLQEINSAPKNQQVSHTPTAILTRSASDTSLAMNELAMKYLPNEKLSELLKELDMDCPLTIATSNLPTSTVGVNMDKFEKGPSDISNASYKYLKKYRLLPEDHEEHNDNNAVEGIMENDNENRMTHIRNAPMNQRQTATNKWPPYPGRLPLSPLVTASPMPLKSAVNQNIVNLENIKHQPKFL